jgi:hypothetical protein
MLGPQEESACITAFYVIYQMYIQKEGSPTDFLDQCIVHLRYVFVQAYDSRPFKERLGNQLRRLDSTGCGCFPHPQIVSPVQHLPKLGETGLLDG